MATIQAVKARQISDSRGDPTVEVGVTLSDGTFTTAATTIASAASTAINVALELRAGGSDYLGKGFLKDVDYVNSIIAPALIGMDPTDQVKIDNLLQELAWTVNEWGWWFKGTLGPNAILAVSLAVRKAGAMVNKISLYEHTAILARNKTPLLPVPAFNVINGGYHAGNKLARQEFMILPIAASSFEEAIEMGVEVYQHLKAEIKNKYGQDVSDDGFEGRFTPNIQENKVVLGLLKTSIAKAGYTGKVVIGMVVDASYDNKHDLNLKKEGDQTGPRSFLSDYPIVSIEDPFDQDDSEHYAKMIVKIHEPVLIVDGALLVTDHKKNDKISGDSLKNVYKSFDDSDWEHYAKQIAEIREPIQIMCTACAEAKDDNDPASFHPCVNDLLLTCSKTKAGPIGRPSPVGSNDQFAAFRLF